MKFPRFTQTIRTAKGLTRLENAAIQQSLAKDFLACFAMFVLVLIMFARVLFSSDVLVYNGDINYFLAHETVIQNSLAEGDFPFWNPYFGGGSPGIGKIQVGLFYPPTAFLRWWLPPVSLFNWDVLLHVYIAGLGMYWLLRDFGAMRSAALFAGLIFMFSGSIFPRILAGHVSILHSIVWIGWLLFAYRRMLYRRNYIYLLSMILCIALVILGGHPQMSLIILLIPLAFFVRFSKKRIRNKDWRLLGIGFMMSVSAVIAAISLVAVQLLPFAEWLGQTARGQGVAFQTFEVFVRQSVDIRHIFTVLLPFLWFDVSTQTSIQEGATHIWEISPFTGITSLFVIFLGISLTKNSSRSRIYFFSILALLGWILSLGSLPIYKWLFPQYVFFRAPGRFLILWTFSIAVIAGICLNDLVDSFSIASRQHLYKRFRNLTLELAILIIIVAILWQFFGAYIISAKKIPDIYQGVVFATFRRASAVLAFTISLFVALLWLVPKDHRTIRPWSYFIIAATIVEMYLFAWPLVRPLPIEQLVDENSPLTKLRLDASKDRVDGYRQPPMYLLPTLRHVLNGEEHIFLETLLKLPDRLGEKLLASDYILTSEKEEEIVSKLVSNSQSDYLYKMGDALPRLYAVPSVKIAYSDSNSLDGIVDKSFEPYDYAMLTLTDSVPESDILDLLNNDFKGPANYTAEYSEYGNNTLRVAVSADNPMMLIFSEMYDSNWQATLDGDDVPIWRVNYAFRGVVIPSGKHEITMQYQSKSFTRGLTISISTIAVFTFFSILLLFRWFIHKWRRPNLQDSTLALSR